MQPEVYIDQVKLFPCRVPTVHLGTTGSTDSRFTFVTSSILGEKARSEPRDPSRFNSTILGIWTYDNRPIQTYRFIETELVINYSTPKRW
jgi:hypothetical protein